MKNTFGPDLRVAAPAAPTRQQVVEKLRKAIIEGHFASGGRLIERDLCERTGVSRGSVREALRQVEAEGLIKIIPNVGPIVAMLSAEEVRQIFEVQAELLGLVGCLFVQHAPASACAELARCLKEMDCKIREGDWEELQTINTMFFEKLMEGTGNDFLAAEVTRIRARVSAFRKMRLSSKEDATKRLEELRLIVEALKLRDARAARRACAAHIKSSAMLAIRVLSSETASRERRARRVAE